MNDAFIDTDVIVRLLSGDDLSKQSAARSLFERVSNGDVTLHAPVTAIADAVFVLASRNLYALPRRQIQEQLSALLRLTEFRVRDKRVLLRALELFAETTLGFGDVMLAAAMEDADIPQIYSFDHDFDRLGFARQEP